MQSSFGLFVCCAECNLCDTIYRKVRKAEGGSLESDFITKVFLKDGSERWVLLHIEVQNKDLQSLPERMYKYKSYIYVKHGVEPAALAIITGSGSDGKGYYVSDVYGTRTEYRYNRLSVKNLDSEDLKSSDNPFDLALLAAKLALESSGEKPVKELLRYRYLRRLVKFLLTRGYNHHDTVMFLGFLETVLKLQNPTLIEKIKEYERTFDEEEGKMLIPYLGQEYWEKGIKEGLKEGRTEGMAKIISSMLRNGMKKEELSSYTGFSVSQLEELERSYQESANIKA